MYKMPKIPVKKQFSHNLQDVLLFAVTGLAKFVTGRLRYAVMVVNTICP
jgi:hypothetical protein